MWSLNFSRNHKRLPEKHSHMSNELIILQAHGSQTLETQKKKPWPHALWHKPHYLASLSLSFCPDKIGSWHLPSGCREDLWDPDIQSTDLDSASAWAWLPKASFNDAHRILFFLPLPSTLLLLLPGQGFPFSSSLDGLETFNLLSLNR